jgi:hypothetical protein
MSAGVVQLSLDIEDKLEVDFRHFIHARPDVLVRVITLAYELKAASKGPGAQGSMETIFGKLRWDEYLRTGGQFKINDHLSSRMSRLVMQLEPALDGFFVTRVLKADRERA